MHPNTDSITIVSDPARIDFDKVQSMLSVAYWSPGITINEIRQGVANSTLVVGAYADNLNQVGFLRVLSDKTRFAYLMDVIVEEQFRKKGIAGKMVEFAMAHPELSDVYQWLLCTRDAHAVYAAVKFKPLEHPSHWMMINKGRSNRKKFESDGIQILRTI
jgi:ribosomal protein S18 acetylase RimI-like enzyme